MRSMFLALAALLLCLTHYTTYAEIHGMLSGHVADDKGNPLVGATVLIEGTARGGYTKADGRFMIIKIPAGNHTVRVRSLGFKEHIRQVEIAPDQTTEINVVLAPDQRTTDKIIITSGKLQPESIGTVRSISALQNLPVEAVQSVVASQPGLVPCFSNLNIRGGRTTETQFRINGLDINDQFTGGRGSTPMSYYPSTDNTSTKHSFRRITPILTTTDDDRFSTFGMNADNASYVLARSYLGSNRVPPQNSIRPEEFLNYFDYGYAAPCEDEFAVYMECAPSMFASDSTHLLKIGIKARELYNDERSAAVLTFVIDISGSMEDDLPMIQNTLNSLVKKLRPDDMVSIVTFGSTAEIHLKPTSVEQRGTIINSIEALRITGSTNVGAGMKLGYDMAAAGFDAQKINRVIFLGDGVANNGLTTSDAILQTIKESAEKGIALTMIGMGMGSYNDVLMEELANRGNGKYFYLDSERELNAILNNNFVGLLDDVARDAKIQVEFDPLVVQSYRLIGYENRAIADSLFRDDTQDAGEVGAGHTVTALYEVQLRPNSEGTVARTAIRYFIGRSTRVREIQQNISTKQIQHSYQEAGYSFKLAAVAAKFAEFLRGTFRKDQSVAELVDYSKEVATLSGELPETRELQELVMAAAFAGGTGSAIIDP